MSCGDRQVIPSGATLLGVEGGRQAMTKQHIEEFSDSVFAVAITLLVVNFKVTGIPQAELRSQVLGQWAG